MPVLIRIDHLANVVEILYDVQCQSGAVHARSGATAFASVADSHELAADFNLTIDLPEEGHVPAMSASPIRLDGGLATELQRAGLQVSPPWWTTRCLLTEEKRGILRGVHTRYLAAGAQVITANTFRCNLRSLRAVGLDGAGLGWMVHAAVGVAAAARNEAGSGTTLLAASMAPVEDCYRPELVPPDDELRAEHRWLATEIMRAGVDVILIETMNTLREARIALEQVQAVRGRAWVSFVCADGARLLSGECVADAARAVEADGAEAVLVNCTPLAETEECLRHMREVCHGPIGAYPNVEDRSGVPQAARDVRPLPAAVSADQFATTLRRWHDELGVTLLGGCCGTSPMYIAALRDQLDCTAIAETRGDGAS
jgi:S-methylmethionine-dependent homocysteine/selenocysteine methylase